MKRLTAVGLCIALLGCVGVDRKTRTTTPMYYIDPYKYQAEDDARARRWGIMNERWGITKEGEKPFSQYTVGYIKEMNEVWRRANDEFKVAPRRMREEFWRDVALENHARIQKIRLQQMQMEQDAAQLVNYQARQSELSKLRSGEQDLETTKENIKLLTEFGIRQGILPNNVATSKELKSDLAEADAIEKEIIEATKASKIK